MNTFMAYAGGIPTFITLGFFVFAIFFLSSKKVLCIRKLREVKSHSKIANKNYYAIKELLPTCKPLTRLKFMILVGTKRWRDYNYKG